MSITDWPAAERPREKLLQRGSSSLSDAELLAIFLRTGVAGKTAVDVSRDLLSNFGSLRALLMASQQDFCRAQGLGPAKYALMQAVLEMSRRHLNESLADHRIDFASSREVKEFLSIRLRDKPSECFAALYLNSQHQLIEYKELFNGTIDSAGVYPREVVKDALSVNAAAVIFAHNHPSGIAEPSQADRMITQRLKDALGLVDIRTLDHLVVGDSQIVSLAERGWL